MNSPIPDTPPDRKDEEGGMRLRVTMEDAKHALQSASIGYDKSGDEHYNAISALHKSIRGSDPQAAVRAPVHFSVFVSSICLKFMYTHLQIQFRFPPMLSHIFLYERASSPRVHILLRPSSLKNRTHKLMFLSLFLAARGHGWRALRAHEQQLFFSDRSVIPKTSARPSPNDGDSSADDLRCRRSTGWLACSRQEKTPCTSHGG